MFHQVLLFEKATFLVIAHADLSKHRDAHRFEKVSNIIKQFKLSCRYSSAREWNGNNQKVSYSKTGSYFEYIHVKNSHFSAFIDSFTPNTFVMVSEAFLS